MSDAPPASAAVDGNITGVGVSTQHPVRTRPQVRGKFLYVGDDKFLVRGVTYGPFRPGDDGCEYHTPEQVAHDFALMRRHGINAVRTYTVPPRWLLDIAADHGLRVMIGLPWEQHICFLDDAATGQRIERSVRQGVRACAGHPAVLAYAVGNEIPASIVRWSGPRRVERFLRRLCAAVREEDREALVTYVNFPTTEYLQLPFVDFLAFNVYLEDPDALTAYMARLQNVADDRPLVMAEVGLDSLRNGETAQAETLDWQVRTAFAEGAGGMFLFSWTDEWYRGGHEIDDWAFGLTTRQREPKPALSAIARAYAGTPFEADRDWPSVSVVICTYNGGRTIGQTLERVAELDYPDYEVIVIDDGSTDATRQILAEFESVARVIHTANGGLSRARNLGMEQARGQVVAYLDDDAYPDRHWLYYLAHRLRTSDHVGVGGPNLPPPEDGWLAHCVAHSPGGPNHVLIDDRTAEHIPGCNMAFWKTALEAIGGFDPQFRTAGDDVDVCWRLQERDGTIGFHAAAVVWHHRRPSLKTYLRQQRGYGQAEAMLEAKWPQKYNGLGHAIWHGELYGHGVPRPLQWRRWRVYHGVWGSAPFQRVYPQPISLAQFMPLMPEWYLLVIALMLVAIPGMIWQPLLLAVPLLALAIGAPLAQSVMNALRAPLRTSGLPVGLKQRAAIAAMHQLQPLARLWGRLRARGRERRHRPSFAWPRLHRDELVDEHWRSPEQRLESLEAALRHMGVRVYRGGDWDRHDLELRLGLFCTARVVMAVEEHGSCQVVRLRCWPRLTPAVNALTFGSLGLAGVLWLWQSPGAAVVLATVAGCLLVRAVMDAAVLNRAYRATLALPLQPESAWEQA